MSRLQLHGRPWVVFDAKNKEHRQWFADFNKSAQWGRCPVRFVVNEDHGDLITQIQRELIQFYVDKEFGTEKSPRVRPKPVAKKPQTKLEKVVDSLAKRPYN
jgi:hypothetical protein